MFILLFSGAVFLLFSGLNDDRSISLTIYYGVIYGAVIAFGVLWRSGTVALKEEGFLLKKSIFHRKRYFKYERIDKIEFLFYPTGGGRYGHGEPAIVIYFKKNKRPQVVLEIQYELVKQLLEKIPSNSQVKIEFDSLRRFSAKYQELLKDYLTGRQKEDLKRMIAKKEEKQKKKANK